MILGDIIERNAELYPDALAIDADGVRFTFAEYRDRCCRLANVLIEAGCGRGDRVAVLALNGNPYLEVFGAGELCGFVTSTLNYRLAVPELIYILNDSGPKVLIYDDEFAETVAELRPQLSTVETFIRIGGALEAALESGSLPYEQTLGGSPASRPALRALEDDTAFIIYTSGTTGRPKGAMLGHRGQVFNVMSTCIEARVDPTDRMLVTNPLYHAGGKWMQMAFHARGCPVYLHRHFDPANVLRTVDREKITATILPASMLQKVLEAPSEEGSLASLTKIYYSAAPIPTPLLRKAIGRFGPILIQFYGCTEAGGVGTCLHQLQHTIDGPPEMQKRLASGGQPKLFAAMKIVRDDGSECEIGEAGEILLKSAAQMQGYWNHSEGTAEAIRDGWLHTGDIGRRDEEDFVYVVDRKKDLIISGGVNIYSREVEDVLHEHPSVSEAAVIAIPHAEWGETVHAVIATRDGAELTPETIINHCRQRMASFKKPTSVSFVPSLPRLPNGKINKLSLREPFWEGYDRRVN